MSLETMIIFNEKEDVWMISPKGDLDIYTSNEFKNNLLDAFEDKQVDLLIDGTNLEYVDSTGLGALISILKTIKDHDKEIILENIKANIRKLFYITELDKLFVIRGEDND